MKPTDLASRVVLGYVGGHDPYISVLEIAWPSRIEPPVYLVRSSRRGGAEELAELREDARIRGGAGGMGNNTSMSNGRETAGRVWGGNGTARKEAVNYNLPLPALVAATDELDAQFLEGLGYDVNWVRAVKGPGDLTNTPACVAVPFAELETILRRLALQKRLRFPLALSALGLRAGSELVPEDRELLALGLSVWYGFQRDDGLRRQIQRPRRLAAPEVEEEPWEAELEPREDPVQEAVAAIRLRR
jgi:hypothetical protein